MKNSRQTSSNKGTCGANANSPEDPTDCSEGDKLTASMLTKALNSLRVDICTKIELAIGGVQADNRCCQRRINFVCNQLTENCRRPRGASKGAGDVS